MSRTVIFYRKKNKRDKIVKDTEIYNLSCETEFTGPIYCLRLFYNLL